ncbi:MAG: energy-coupling factor transporter transmembrane protein EcfT [Oscillospiraceae bacterium]|nr:energy-coupling factor transporter transmembrane protein EcfT [Oscillospiraceae bacterium]
MNDAERAVLDLRAMDELESMDSPLHRLSPLSKFTVTAVYIALTASFGRYDLTGLLFMVIFPLIGYQLAMIPVRTCFSRLKGVLPLVAAVGVLNPFFDRNVLFRIGGIAVTGGVVSMLTLMMKGVFCLMASFLLMATTAVDELCRDLRKLHFPKMLASLILLTFRYTSVLTDEVAAMTQAYSLRAPGQKGIHISVWGTFLGQLLLRTMDRADDLYDAMVLRGFNGEFHYAGGRKSSRWSWPAAALSCAAIVAARLVNVPALLGSLFI